MLGNLVINGVVTPAATGAKTAHASNPLATGLSIRGQTSAQIASIDNPGVKKADSSSHSNINSKTQNVGKNFADTLMSRLEKERLKAESSDKKTFEDTKAFMDSLTGTIDEIKNQFGQETANQVMAEILVNTESGLTGGRIAQAVTGALQGLATTAAETISNGMGTASEVEAAYNTENKLKEFLAFLNQETIGETDSDDTATDGLSVALNNYFQTFVLAKEDQKIFDSDFSWKTAREISESNSTESGLGYDIELKVKELGRIHVDALAEFLRTDLGHEEAATYIENLGDDDDIFAAVDHIRNMFFENSEIIAPGIDSETGLPSLQRREGQGVEQVQKLNEFLNSNMLDTLNSTFRNNSELSNRLKSYAASMYYGGKIEDVPAGIGLTTWPGGLLIPGPTDAHSPRSIDLFDIGDTTAADRQEQFLAQAGDFWREISKNHSAENKQKYEQFAQDADKKFKEYLLGKSETAPGALVDQQA